MDIGYFEQMWTGKKADKAASRVFWDGRAEEFNDKSQNSSDKRMERIIELLSSKGVPGEAGSVLDIGCGPGKYAVEFAKRAGHVVGIDLSPRMITFAKENAAEAEISNISFEVMDWETADIKAMGWENKFDLVFASMCPAINSSNALEKMTAASKDYCFMSTFVERRDAVRDHLGGVLDGEHVKKDFSKTIYCAFNILWLRGFHPEIQYLDVKWEKMYPLEKAVTMYTSHFEMGRTLNLQQKEQISGCLKEMADQGIVNERIDAKIAWMYWKV